MIKPLFGVAVAAVAFTASSASAQLFTEDWDDGLGAGRWSAPIVALECVACGWDGSLDYAFDYSTIFAPSAPNSTGGTTIGVMMESNTTSNKINGVTVFQGESVGIIPTGFVLPAGDFTFTADTYIFWNGGPGSTEYATLGAYSGGTAVPLRFGLDNGDGVAWSVDSDGDSSIDFLRFEGPGGGEFDTGAYESIPDGTIPGVGTGDNSVTQHPLGIGPANRWVELKIESVAGIVSFSMNGYVMGGTIDNTGGAFTGGTILLSQSDPFDSVNSDDPTFGLSNVVIFDNIVVTPEPASIALLGLGGLAMLRRR